MYNIYVIETLQPQWSGVPARYDHVVEQYRRREKSLGIGQSMYNIYVISILLQYVIGQQEKGRYGTTRRFDRTI